MTLTPLRLLVSFILLTILLLNRNDICYFNPTWTRLFLILAEPYFQIGLYNLFFTKIGTKVPCYERNKFQNKLFQKLHCHMMTSLLISKYMVKRGFSLNCLKNGVEIFFSALCFDSIRKKVIESNSIVKNSKFQFFQDGGTAAALGLRFCLISQPSFAYFCWQNWARKLKFCTQLQIIIKNKKTYNKDTLDTFIYEN